MKRFLVMALLVFTICKMQAQRISSNQQPGWGHRFHSFNTVQVLNGSTTTSFAIHSVNGFQFGKFFSGVGAGFDYYYHLSVPLFIEARFDLLKRKRKLQMFGNGGINIPFASPNKNLETNMGSYKTGSMYGAGLDYLIPVKKEAFIMGVAFSNKQVIQMVDNNVWNPVLNRTENIPIRDSYLLNRIAIRVGWMF